MRDKGSKGKGRREQQKKAMPGPQAKSERKTGRNRFDQHGALPIGR